MERHVQTIFLGVCTAAVCALAKVGWEMSHQLTQQSEQLASVGNTVIQLRTEVDKINDRFSQYLTRNEAEAKLSALRERADDNARRIERLETREGL